VELLVDSLFNIAVACVFYRHSQAVVAVTTSFFVQRVFLGQSLTGLATSATVLRSRMNRCTVPAHSRPGLIDDRTKAFFLQQELIKATCFDLRELSRLHKGGGVASSTL